MLVNLETMLLAQSPEFVLKGNVTMVFLLALNGGLSGRAFSFLNTDPRRH